MRPEHDTEEVKSNQVEDESNQVKAEHDTISLQHDTNSSKNVTQHDTEEVEYGTNQAQHDTKKPKITNKQKDILNFCSVPRTRAEILARAGVSYHSKNLHTYIGSLVEFGFLEMTNPEFPSVKSEVYKKRSNNLY